MPRCIVLTSLLVCSAVARADNRPNIVVIAIDDLRFDAISAYGSPYNVTPNLNRLAAEGARFDASYATTPLCSPWRVSMLTGQYMSAHGWTGNDIHASRRPDLDDATMWQEVLQDSGYRTGLIGKYHVDTWLGNGGPGRNGDPRPGWDYWAGFENNQGTHTNVQLNVNGTFTQTSGYTSNTIANYAEAFLNGTPANEPFALYVAYKAVHTPLGNANNVSPGNRNVISNAEAQAYVNSLPAANYDQAILDVNKPVLTRAGGPAGGNPVPGVTGRNNTEIAGTFGLLKDIDDSIGRILNNLQASGELDNTLVIFSSDSGLAWREHGLGDKSVPYESVTRTPLLVRGPGVVAGSTPQQFVNNADIGPTVLSLAGVDIPSSMQGESFLPYASGQGGSGRQYLYVEQNFDGWAPSSNSFQSVQTKQFKYIRYNDYEGVDELYNLQNDPAEIYNVINNRAFVEQVTTLRRQIQLEHGAALTPGATSPIYAVQSQFNDYSLAESGAVLDNKGLGATQRVGALASQGGGRNTFFMFELPVLSDGEQVMEADFRVLVTQKTGNIPAALGGDLWALGVFDDDALSRTFDDYLESESDPTMRDHIKVQDDFLTSQTPADAIIRSNDAASDIFSGMLNAFYAANPAYSGGKYLFLRLNPDMNLGTSDIGWDLAPRESGEYSADPLLVITAGLAGDYNEDGFVDAADYTVWRDNVGAPAGTLENDPLQGTIGMAQYETWRDNFGVGTPGIPSNVQGVPEPASLTVAVLCGLFLSHRRRGVPHRS